VQGELYLTDAIEIIATGGGKVAAHIAADSRETDGVNTRVELAHAGAVLRDRINEAHMLAGVTIVDPSATVIDVDVEIGQDTVIEPFTSVRGQTRIGERTTVGPHATVIDTRIGDEASILHSYLKDADVGDRVSVGPFAYLRPGAVLREGSKAGTFVEIKNSEIGRGTKVPHLSYIGDADIGEQTNLGAATITANYDGHRKHRTTIGARVKTSVDTTLIAPVTVGDDAYTAAGSVISEDIPPGALGVARARQTNVEGYTERRKQREESRKDEEISG
jgi:bifunctional UDP-N-acetylglucosamine pyrophosphorylase/glucosamine-1-phosphate N-acetyltransferase